MKLLSGIILTIFLIMFIVSASEVVKGEDYNEGYNLERPIENFIPDILAYIKELIVKNETLIAKFIQDDFAVMVYKTLKNEKLDAKFEIPSYLILFDGIKNKEEKIGIIGNKIIRDFKKDRIDNIKEIFWFDGETSRSWSKKDMVLKEEERCGCGCVEGKFALRLCQYKICFYKNDIKINH